MLNTAFFDATLAALRVTPNDSLNTYKATMLNCAPHNYTLTLEASRDGIFRDPLTLVLNHIPEGITSLVSYTGAPIDLRITQNQASGLSTVYVDIPDGTEIHPRGRTNGQEVFGLERQLIHSKTKNGVDEKRTIKWGTGCLNDQSAEGQLMTLDMMHELLGCILTRTQQTGPCLKENVALSEATHTQPLIDLLNWAAGRTAALHQELSGTKQRLESEHFYPNQEP